MKEKKSCQKRQFPWRELSYWDNPGWIHFLEWLGVSTIIIAGIKTKKNKKNTPTLSEQKSLFLWGRCVRYCLHQSDSPNAEYGWKPVHLGYNRLVRGSLPRTRRVPQHSFAGALLLNLELSTVQHRLIYSNSCSRNDHLHSRIILQH